MIGLGIQDGLAQVLRLGKVACRVSVGGTLHGIGQRQRNYICLGDGWGHRLAFAPARHERRSG